MITGFVQAVYGHIVAAVLTMAGLLSHHGRPDDYSV